MQWAKVTHWQVKQQKRNENVHPPHSPVVPLMHSGVKHHEHLSACRLNRVTQICFITSVCVCFSLHTRSLCWLFPLGAELCPVMLCWVLPCPHSPAAHSSTHKAGCHPSHSPCAPIHDYPLSKTARKAMTVTVPRKYHLFVFKDQLFNCL